MTRVDDESICPHCNGSGEGMCDETICHYCRGSGVERESSIGSPIFDTRVFRENADAAEFMRDM